jgi:DNA modification methylase
VSGTVPSGRRLRPYVLVRQAQVQAERPPGADEDVHFAESLVSAVLEDLTSPRDRVLDPFAGYGTTLRVAEQMGREAVGIELVRDRCDHIAAVAPGSLVVRGDARDLHRLVEPPFDLVLTSPPYMTATDHPEDPLAAYTGTGADYERYLGGLREVFEQALAVLRPTGHLVVNVANIDTGDHFTPLAWDVGRVLADVGRLVQDVFVCWDRSWHDLAGDYLLVVRQSR